MNRITVSIVSVVATLIFVATAWASINFLEANLKQSAQNLPVPSGTYQAPSGNDATGTCHPSYDGDYTNDGYCPDDPNWVKNQ